MTNKQYIYSGNGDPDNNGVIPGAITAHYLDLDSGDIWLWDTIGWRRIYVGGSDGSIASFTGYGEPQDQPNCPSIYTAHDDGIFRMYIAIFKYGEYWDWEEVKLGITEAPS